MKISTEWRIEDVPGYAVEHKERLKGFIKRALLMPETQAGVQELFDQLGNQNLPRLAIYIEGVAKTTRLGYRWELAGDACYVSPQIENMDGSCVSTMDRLAIWWQIANIMGMDLEEEFQQAAAVALLRMKYRLDGCFIRTPEGTTKEIAMNSDGRMAVQLDGIWTTQFGEEIEEEIITARGWTVVRL